MSESKIQKHFTQHTFNLNNLVGTYSQRVLKPINLIASFTQEKGETPKFLLRTSPIAYQIKQDMLNKRTPKKLND